MAVIVGAIEADLACDPRGSGNGNPQSGIMISSADFTRYVLLWRYVLGLRDHWWVRTSESADAAIAGGDGTGRIELTESGSSVLWEAFVDGVSKASGTLANADTIDFNQVFVAITRAQNDDSGHSRNSRTRVEAFSTLTCGWDAVAELDDWQAWLTYPKPRMTGSYLTTQTDNHLSYIIRTYTAKQLSSCLVAPGVYRRAVSFGGDLQTFYEANAGTHILSGSADLYPELLSLNASSAALAMILQRDEQGVSNVYYSLGGGAEAAGAWGAVQTIIADRAKPCACVLEPTHDCFVIDVDGSNHIAYGQRLAWDGSAFIVGSEVEVSSGDVANERGHVVWNPNKGQLLFAYADTSGVVQLLTSNDCGATWA